MLDRRLWNSRVVDVTMIVATAFNFSSSHELIAVSDTSNGQYVIVYGHTSAGTYRLDVSVAGIVLPAAAFEDEDNNVIISPGGVSLAAGDGSLAHDGLLLTIPLSPSMYAGPMYITSC